MHRSLRKLTEQMVAYRDKVSTGFYCFAWMDYVSACRDELEVDTEYPLHRDKETPKTFWLYWNQVSEGTNPTYNKHGN